MSAGSNTPDEAMNQTKTSQAAADRLSVEIFGLISAHLQDIPTDPDKTQTKCGRKKDRAMWEYQSDLLNLMRVSKVSVAPQASQLLLMLIWQVLPTEDDFKTL